MYFNLGTSHYLWWGGGRGGMRGGHRYNKIDKRGEGIKFFFNQKENVDLESFKCVLCRKQLIRNQITQNVFRLRATHMLNTVSPYGLCPMWPLISNAMYVEWIKTGFKSIVYIRGRAGGVAGGFSLLTFWLGQNKNCHVHNTCMHAVFIKGLLSRKCLEKPCVEFIFWIVCVALGYQFTILRIVIM